MPVGRYTLTATFVLDTRASGVCDSHAVADFSPDTALPPEWVRTRDPFQGVSKKSFGFTATVTAAPPPARDTGRTGLAAEPGAAAPLPPAGAGRATRSAAVVLTAPQARSPDPRQRKPGHQTGADPGFAVNPPRCHPPILKEFRSERE